MLENLPIHISLTFVITTIVTLFLFLYTIGSSNSATTAIKAKPIAIGLILWLIIQAVLSLNNIYVDDTNNFPSKIIVIGILPAIFGILLLFITSKGRSFIDDLQIKNLTYINIVRIPIEIILFWLYINKFVPELMTFKGVNFDIIAGLSAPFIGHFGFNKDKIHISAILIWNIICLVLLLTIVFLALFSAPSPIQKLAFDQPNIAILYFPFSWLPTFIVPIILFGHLVSIRKLMQVKHQLT